MTASSYDGALKRVLVHEGGYANHPADPGGATNRGVTQRVYDGWRTRKGQPARSVREITPAEVAAIYDMQYWDKVRGDDLPAGIDYVVFDGGVHSGPVQSVKWLQRALGVAADGSIGAATLGALEAHPDHDALIADIIARRLAMLRGLKTWSTFGKGWSSRLKDVLAHGQALARGSVGPKPTYTAAGAAPARIADIATPPAPIGGSAGAVAGGGGVAVVIDQAKDTLQPMVGGGGVVDTIFAGLVATGIVVAVGGVAYGIWASRRNKAASAILSGDAVADISGLAEAA
ncbi:lysozyme family protein [Angulomicrobium tetraedrale]|uniref:Lysozyme family protein n=1 Tax=Ancylobacter tetraedralis TaxID=217068 RepID=A0A839Z9U2_9HYPH|nr:glycoside hydrolase family 108 protein [Ancylobacter tetraedralis]MBB3771503.1 lysozyme family protein [Ancylobacter tetraedralis]